MDLKISREEIEEKERKIVVMGVNGVLDIYTAPEMKRALEDEINIGNLIIIINLEGCRYIDNSGLGTLIKKYNNIKGEDGFFGLVCGKAGQIRMIFNMTGLCKIFKIFETQEEALEAAKTHILATAKTS